MRCRPGPALLFAAALAACGGSGGDDDDDGSSDDAGGSRRLGFPPESSLYHGVYPGGPSGLEDDITSALVDEYEEMVGRQTAWVSFAHNWFAGRAFPATTCQWIHDRGAVPFVRLMLRSSAAGDQAATEDVFTLAAINAGSFDADLQAWGDAAGAHPGPLLVEWGTEMNRDGFSWNARWNGEEAGGAAFVTAYRRIHDLIAERAPNAVWVWHVDAESSPAEPWNELESYFPGTDYVDWIGVSRYGAVTPLDATFPSFRAGLDAVVPRLFALAPARPIMVVEFGATAGNPLGDPVEYVEQALADLLNVRWPQIRGFAWWNDDDPDRGADMRVQTVSNLGGAIRLRISAATSVFDRPILY